MYLIKVPVFEVGVFVDRVSLECCLSYFTKVHVTTYGEQSLFYTFVSFSKSVSCLVVVFKGQACLLTVFHSSVACIERTASFFLFFFLNYHIIRAGMYNMI